MQKYGGGRGLYPRPSALDKNPLTAYKKWVKLPLGDRLTAGLQTLDLPIQVRILVPQPIACHIPG